jgi:ABC-2 type transport system ATP-binding protein
VLDEPTLGLDVVAKRAFLEALMFSNMSDESTIVYCSHQMEEIERVADNLVILERGKLRHMSAPAEFCERVHLWVAEFPFRDPDTRQLPGVLQVQRIDGFTHVIVFDQGEDFGARLKLMGARSAHMMPVSLDRAVNGLLSSGHISTTPASAAA